MSSVQKVSQALISAVSQGQMTQQVADAMLEPLDDIASAGAEGVSIDDIDSEQVTLITVMLDGSGSMATFQDQVIDAYNKQFLAPMVKAKNAESILVEAWVFFEQEVRLVHGFLPVTQCQKLSRSTFDPNGATPLYQAVHQGLTGLAAYAQTLRDSGTSTKCIAVVISDGGENSSARQFTSAKLRTISAGLLSQEIYVLSYCFFGDESNASQIASEIGFPDHHRLTESMDESGIRRLFGQVSASAISTSQAKVNANSLSQNTFIVNP